nr:protein ENHANCED DISEASE RESISTANCE 2 [Ipomoea batatas]
MWFYWLLVVEESYDHSMGATHDLELMDVILLPISLSVFHMQQAKKRGIAEHTDCLTRTFTAILVLLAAERKCIVKIGEMVVLECINFCCEDSILHNDGKIDVEIIELSPIGILDIGKELNPNVSPLMLNPSDFHGTMQQGKDEKDTNCWTSPGGSGFMIRGKTYLKDNTKVKGGDPLLKLIAVDWFTLENSITKLALHPRCLVQLLHGRLGTYTPNQALPDVLWHKRLRYTARAGLKEYIGATPALTFEASTVIVHSKTSDVSMPNGECEGEEGADQFYDAITDKKVKLKNVSWAIASLALRRDSVLDIGKELNPNVSPLMLNPSDFHGTMQQGKDEKDTNCWTSPGGSGFMIRGKTYLKDNTKVKGGDPLLKLIAVDWFTLENSITKLALHPRCLVQVPAKPNYSLVLYYAADRPVNKDSLLGKFIDGTDLYRDSRFKLIPSIIEGYWMVKRAVGTKACLLGKAVTCKYLRQDNFLEIDVDIGSSSVARSIIGLVLGYVTSLVVDLAILIEAKEEAELPEYILGTVRLNRVRLDSAVPLDV